MNDRDNDTHHSGGGGEGVSWSYSIHTILISLQHWQKLYSAAVLEPRTDQEWDHKDLEETQIGLVPRSDHIINLCKVIGLYSLDFALVLLDTDNELYSLYYGVVLSCRVWFFFYNFNV